mmetsp:Transcript_14466/g.43197  ORF Transcript_14466/g.43197 Transcript_14466/m.43197 type:complete len:270 (+) Transcript_14466:232-1041(+)|eukprot:CAMPEP_0119269826 /NCGR_PEP_ID=MMETSP1329-20130426/7070_1 /TAXON_ID=114041 /ORGANISM="Genus nov. species nov., Strain RCC1024" /LENGTH=269 /DNA_ID=CAMNT_0007269827 /DNA_START=214 /DNA_END=1023 /DNA_ORIENTATION=-
MMQDPVPVGLNAKALEHLTSSPVHVTESVFQRPSAEPKYKFVCSPPASPDQKRKAPAVTPDAGPRGVDALPPPLDLDGSPRAKKYRFVCSLAAVSEEAQGREEEVEDSKEFDDAEPAAGHYGPCDKCGAPGLAACQGAGFARSELDYFNPCEGSVCLECAAPECGECGEKIRALPFCEACLEMVQYESGSHVAGVPAYAKYLCKGGGDDCCCNALVCDKCHARADHVAAFAAAHEALGPGKLKYVLQEPITQHTRLCGGCTGRLTSLEE